ASCYLRGHLTRRQSLRSPEAHFSALRMAGREEEFDDEDEGSDEEAKGSYAVVHSMGDRPVIACTIFDQREAPIAHRQWVLEPDGIHIYCACGKDGKPVKVKANPDGSTEIIEPFHDECSETI